MNDQLETTRTDLATGAILLGVDGILDRANYRTLRDTIIKAALEEPRAVIVDINLLAVPYESSLAVFTSARWHIVRWPDVPLLLVCRSERGRNRLERNGISRFVPVYADVLEAIAALAEPFLARQRVRVKLAAGWSSVAQARDLTTEWLPAWSNAELLPVAKVVVTALVENAVGHTAGPTALRLESMGQEVAIAVEDPSPVPANFREDVLDAEHISSLQIVDAVCRAWGCSPAADGKVVWCVIGPENRL